MNTFALGIIMLIFAGLAMDTKAYWMAAVLFLIGGLIIIAHITSPNP